MSAIAERLPAADPLDSLHFGLFARIGLTPETESPAAKLLPGRQGDLFTWEGRGATVAMRGTGAYVPTRSGWDVFVLGASEERARRITELLSPILGRAAAGQGVEAGGHAVGDLCMQMLPMSVVVAFNRTTGTACLLRDGCGFIPLYYAVHGGTLTVSNDLPAVRAHLPSNAINTDKIDEMLLFGHRTGRRTLWQNINTVPPGDMAVLDSRGSRCSARFHSLWTPASLFQVEERHRLERQPLQQTLKEVEATLEASLQPLLSAERVAVPCGGGVDSSLLGAYFAARSPRTTLWCINQPTARITEKAWTQPLADRLGIRCEYVNLDRESFLTALLDMISKGGQPLSGPNMCGGWLLTRQALEDGESHFVFGELCDTVFGGLGGFSSLSPLFRAMRSLSKLPSKLRLRLLRSLHGEAAWLIGTTLHAPIDELAGIGYGNLERAANFQDAVSFRYPGQSDIQHMADMLTWTQFKTVMSSLHHEFHERDQRLGGASYFPFADPAFIRLGLHLPHGIKVRSGHKKWLWRTFASKYIGHEVAFRKKYAFPLPTSRWLDRGELLLDRGFLEECLCLNVGELYQSLPAEHVARWTLLNLELWGRLHCHGESADALLGRLM